MPKPYLLRRPSGLYARFLVPADLRAAVGSRFLVRRLPPGSPDHARLAAAGMAVALCQVFARMRQGAMSDADKLLRELAGSVNKWTGNIELANGHRLTNLKVDGKADAETLLETIRGLGGASLVPAAAPLSRETLGQRVDAYLADLRNAGRGKGTLLDATNTLTIFRELVGDKHPIACCTQTQVRLFLSSIASWPVNARKKKPLQGKAAPEIVRLTGLHNSTAPDGKKWRLISDRTRNKHRDQLAAFFNAQVAGSIIEKSPLGGIPRHNNAPADQSNRRPFTDDELARAFDLETFQPWTAGKPHRWWGPLLGLVTGARVNEVAQLYCDDLAQVAGAWGVYFRRGRPDQKLKKDTPARFVPLHPGLLKAGLLRYRDDAVAAGHARLFPHLPLHSKAGYGDALGDQWRAYLDTIGITDAGMGFHSFRHLASTLLHYAGVVPAIQSAITGHGLVLPGSMSVYVHPPSLPDRLAAVSHLPMPEGLPVYKKGDATTALEAAHALTKRREINRAAAERRKALKAKTAKS